MAKIAVLGAGNSGHAVAGYLGMFEHEIRLWNRDYEDEVTTWLSPVETSGAIRLYGALDGIGSVRVASSDLKEVVSGVDLIIFSTTTDAYASLTAELAPLLSESQIILLMAPGVLGSLEVARNLTHAGFCGKIQIAETSTTSFGSRDAGDSSVKISSRKAVVEVASLPGTPVERVIELVPELKLCPVRDVLSTSLSSLGTALHVIPMIFNAARIESGEPFRYYIDGVTPAVANAIEQFDTERLRVASAFGYSLDSISNYLIRSLGADAGSLHQSIQGTPAYRTTPAPSRLQHRFLWEDVASGLIPLITLAEIAQVKVGLLQACAELAGVLLGQNFFTGPRSIAAMKLESFDTSAMVQLVSNRETYDSWRNGTER